MLVLARKKEEGIYIGDDIIVRIVEIQGNQVRLGIQAPKDVRIIREEIVQIVREENVQSLATEKPDAEMLNQLLNLTKK